jgi:hypothetical protein
VRDLNDEANPYAGRYSAWDEWIFKNAPVSKSEDIYAWHRGDTKQGYTVLATAVDKDGFVIPAVDYICARNDPNSAINRSSCSYLLEAGGPIDPEVLKEYRVSVAKAMAAWVPPVPSWLADNPPKLAQFYKGEVLVFGALGSGREVWEDSLAEVLDPNSADAWQRYSMDGALITQTEPGGQWWLLYFTDFANVLARLGGEGEVSYFAYQGYVVFSSHSTQKVIAIYDYNGVEQPLTTDFFSAGYENPLYKPLAGGALPWIYAGQHSR